MSLSSGFSVKQEKLFHFLRKKRKCATWRNAEPENEVQNETTHLDDVQTEADFLSVLMDRYGPLMGGADLMKALGYSNSKAFRQARLQNRLGIHVFSIPRRKGPYAHTHDVAAWLSEIGKAKP